MKGESRAPNVGRSPAGRPEDVGVHLAEEHERGPDDEAEDNRSEALPEDAAGEPVGEEERAGKAGYAGEEEQCAGDAGERVDEQEMPVEFVHDAGGSLVATGMLLALLVGCGARQGEMGWAELAVFGSGYGALFACEWFWGSGRSSSWREEKVERFADVRVTVALFGMAAVLFGSPTLLDIAPDVLAVTGAIGGCAEGRALRLVARERGVSLAGAARVAVGTWRRLPEDVR